MAAWMTVATQTDATIRSVATTPRNTVPQRRSRWSADHAPTAVSVAANVANRTAIMAGNDQHSPGRDESTHPFCGPDRGSGPTPCYVLDSLGRTFAVSSLGGEPIPPISRKLHSPLTVLSIAPHVLGYSPFLEHFDAVQQQRRPIRHPYSLRLCCIAKHQEAALDPCPRHLATEQTLRV